MPRINGTRRAAENTKAKSTEKAEKKPSTRRTSSAASGGEGPSSSGRRAEEIFSSSYSAGGEGTPAPSRPSPPVHIPARNVWSSGGGGE